MNTENTDGAERSGRTEPDWQRLEAEQPSDKQIVESYDEPRIGVERSADAAIDVELARNRVDDVFESVGGEEGVSARMVEEDRDRAALESHPDERELRRIGMNAELDEYNGETTDSMVERMHELRPGETAQIMNVPSEAPEGFDSSDGLKQLTLFFDKVDIDGFELPEIGSTSSHTTTDGQFNVSIRAARGSDGRGVLDVTAQRLERDSSTAK